MIVRGGTGVVHSFEVTVTDRSSQDLWLYVGGVGGLVALLLLTLAVPVLRLWPLLVFLPLVSWLGSIFGLSRLLPEIEPTAVQLVVHALCGLPLAVVLALRGRLAYVLLAVLAPLGFWSLSLGMEAHGRLRTGEDPRLTQHFGRDSGIAPRDALSRRLHAKTKVHRLGSGDASVFFLGGGELYEPWPLSDRRPVAYLPLQVETAITEELGRDIEAIVLPTEHATAAQQLLLFEHFYLRAFDPEAVVFGIGDAEQQRSVEDLQRTLEALAQLARTAGFRVLVLQSELLAPAYGELIDRLSKDHGWPLLRGLLATEPSRRLVAELVEQLVRALR